MATQSNTKRMMDALSKARNDIANLTGWLDCELQKYDAQNVTWSTVSSLEHVRENMTETLAFLSGMDQAEIARSLDEMNAPSARATKTGTQETLLKIAKRDLGIETLEERKSDRADFHEFFVSAVKAALEAAYQAGRDSK